MSGNGELGEVATGNENKVDKLHFVLGWKIPWQVPRYKNSSRQV